MKTILIAGGSGLIGSRLSEILIKNGFKVKFLSRKPKNFSLDVETYQWDINNEFIDKKAFEDVSVIIDLAGANIGEKRWSKRRKEDILNSRLKSLNLIYKTVNDLKLPVKSFFYSSAIGYYGALTSEKIFTEADVPGNDFLADVCNKSEKSVLEFQNINIRTVIIRTGIVLSKKGGALNKMVKPAKLCVNSALGSGKQFMPWIHIDDLCQIYLDAIENNNYSGAYNAVSPIECNNFLFSKELSKILHKPFFMPNIPPFILKIMFGEMSSVLLYGSRVSSERLINSGFKFKYSQLSEALSDLLVKNN